MPNEATHRSQAEHNERLARGLILLSPPFTDWAVTACFYAALHLVDSYFARLGSHPSTHGRREREIRNHLPRIEHHYLRLKQYSLDARYQGVQMTPATAFQPTFVENLINTDLEAIKNYVRILLMNVKKYS